MNHYSCAWAAGFVQTVKRCGVRHLLILCVLLAGLPFHAYGQEATIVGTVTDTSGAVVPNVAISLANVDTGVVRTSITNGDGQYVVPGLVIGHYNVTARATGFGVEERNGIVLNVNDRTRVDFVVKLGTSQEKVTVEANVGRGANRFRRSQQRHHRSTDYRASHQRTKRVHAIRPGARCIQHPGTSSPRPRLAVTATSALTASERVTTSNCSMAAKTWTVAE